MRVTMLAAGIGRRLGLGEDAPPKVLLRFDGVSLLQRHLDILAHFGLLDLTLAVGHQAGAIEAELSALGARERVRTRFNPDYGKRSLLSLWALRDVLGAGQEVLYMDADVLYDWRLVERLLSAPHESCILIDRDVVPDADFVDVRVRDDRIVAFDKGVPPGDYDIRGEWVGFARFSAAAAMRLARAIQRYVQDGRVDLIYEHAVRDVMVETPGFGFADATGLPWIEIDFPEDLERARNEILPRLVDLPATAR